MEEEFVSPERVAKITGMSPAALAQLRYRGSGPQFYKPTPRTVRYRQSEVVAWMEASAFSRTRMPVKA
jgi:predicted DNA-binding transcriptional regulator AlpA